MMKWEYKIIGESSEVVSLDNRTGPLYLDKSISFPAKIDDAQAILNKLGDDGWEMISTEYPYIFKRPVMKET